MDDVSQEDAWRRHMMHRIGDKFDKTDKNMDKKVEAVDKKVEAWDVKMNAIMAALGIEGMLPSAPALQACV